MPIEMFCHRMNDVYYVLGWIVIERSNIFEMDIDFLAKMESTFCNAIDEWRLSKKTFVVTLKIRFFDDDAQYYIPGDSYCANNIV